MIDLLLSHGADINQPDFINGFTIVHYAFFTENLYLIQYLLNRGADFSKQDSYFGVAFDYWKLLGILPSIPFIKSLQLFSPQKKIERISIQEFEELFQVNFCPVIRCGHEYIEELMLSGLSIDPDIEFRKKFEDILTERTGDEDLVLAYIDDSIGYGVFAGKDFTAGEFVVRYGGYLSLSDSIEDRDFVMDSGIEGIGLDAKKFRNLGGMINHSAHPNVESQCFFYGGAEQALITAIKDIKKGTQLLLDYDTTKYWENDNETQPEKQSKIVEMWNVSKYESIEWTE